MESVVKINIYPVALFSITDAFERRSEGNSGVIGTLLEINRSEIIVGSEITANSKLVHEDYYQKLCRKQCVFLLVDTSMQSIDIGIKAYTSRPIEVPNKSNGVMFVPIEGQINAHEPERYALDLMKEGLHNKRRFYGDIEQ